jgi:hypothetical protein
MRINGYFHRRLSDAIESGLETFPCALCESVYKQFAVPAIQYHHVSSRAFEQGKVV